MSEQNSSDGFSPGFDDAAQRRGLANPAVRSIAAGAAGLVALGAVAGGFLWVSSDPSTGDVAAAVPGRAPSATTSAPTATGGAAGFAFGGSNPFDGSFLPAEGPASADGVALPAATATSAPRVSPTSTPTAAATQRTTAEPVGNQAPSHVPTKTPTGTAPTTPSPVASTAVPWLKGSVVFKEVSEEAPPAGVFVLDAGSRHPLEVVLPTDTILPSTSTVYRPLGGVPVLVPTSQFSQPAGQEAFGWIPKNETALPDASLGKVTGTLRWLGHQGDKLLVQVDDQEPVWLSVGDQVPGTPLSIADDESTALGRKDVIVFTDGANQFFTVLGGGEGSGVTF